MERDWTERFAKIISSMQFRKAKTQFSTLPSNDLKSRCYRFHNELQGQVFPLDKQINAVIKIRLTFEVLFKLR